MKKSTFIQFIVLVAMLILSAAFVVKIKNAPLKDLYIDDRDGQSYPIVKLENTYWFATNLNFKTERSNCYEDDEIACGTWGQLYPLDEIENVCPDGWRLPNHDDWLILKRIIDTKGVEALYDGSHWKNNEQASNASGLSLVPSGIKHKKKFLHQYLNSTIWFNHSTTEGSNWHFHTDGNNNEAPYYFHTHEHEVYVRKFAVRCVCDEGDLLK